MAVPIPRGLVDACGPSAERARWLAALPRAIERLVREWRLELGSPFLQEASCSWVAPAWRHDGTAAVLKVGMPHFEGEQEIAGLRFWDADPTVRLLAADDGANAMLLERCLPGTALRAQPEPEQDMVIADLLRRLWRSPSPPHPFRPLSAMLQRWNTETRAASARWPDPGLVGDGLSFFGQLPGTAPREVLLATDLHAGNVLAATRSPWLVIDPKPFVGDPAFDATQHLFNCGSRLRADPLGFIERVAGLLALDAVRVRLWAFARAAAEPRDDWSTETMDLARLLAP